MVRLAIYPILVALICSVVSETSQQLPEIWLHSMQKVDSFEEFPAANEFRMQTHFKNEYVSKNGSDFVALSIISSIVLACRAQFPVSWSIPNLDQVENKRLESFDMYSFRKSDFLDGSNQPANKYFEALLRVDFKAAKFLCVNLTCGNSTESKKFPHESSSIHVYYEGQDLIANVNSTIIVYFNQPLSKLSPILGEIRLPCRPATPNITVLLEKQAQSQNQTSGLLNTNWFWIADRFAKFDPKIGFILVTDMIQKSEIRSPLGFYRCTALNDDYDAESNNLRINENAQVVYVNVTKSNETFDFKQSVGPPEFTSTLEVSGNASIYYNEKTFGRKLPPFSRYEKYLADRSVICCTGNRNIASSHYTDNCRDPLQCQLLKYTMAAKTKKWNFKSEGFTVNDYNFPNDCTEFSMVHLDTGIVCKSANLKFAQYFTAQFPRDLLPVRNRSQDENAKLRAFETEETANAADISEKIFLTVGYPVTEEEIGRIRWKNTRATFPLLETYNVQPDNYNHYFDLEVLESISEYKSVRILNGNDTNRRDEKLAEYSRDEFYEMEPLAGICIGWKVRYADGAHVTVLWRNGSRTVLEESVASERVTHKVVYFHKLYDVPLHVVDLVYGFGRPVLAHKDMSALECWMPQWNTEKWDKIVRNLTILESFPPKLVEGDVEEEDVYYYLDDEEKGGTLDWNVMDGTPKPIFEVAKDGELIWSHDGHVPEKPQSPAQDIENVNKIVNVTILEDLVVGDPGDEYSRNITMTKITIKFANITDEIEGVYQFTAENLRGKVIRTFRVIVKDTQGVTWPILVTVIAILSLIVAVIIIHHYWKTKTVYLQCGNGN